MPEQIKNDDSEAIIRAAKNKWDKLKLAQKVRSRRYFIKPNVVRKKKEMSALYIKRKISEDESSK